MRKALAWVHRYVGLSLAGVLLMSALTGSLLAFEREWDAALNPDLFRRAGPGPDLAIDALVAKAARQLPGAVITEVHLPHAGQDTVLLDTATADESPPRFDQVFVDPATGRVLGTRLWGELEFERRNIIPFLYSLHYSLHAPGATGKFVLGGAALLWFLHSCVGLMLAWPRGPPRRTAWARALTVKAQGSSRRRDYQLHRAAGLWLLALTLIIALTGAMMNLQEPLFRPIMSRTMSISPVPSARFAERVSDRNGQQLTFAQAATAAEHIAAFHYAAPWAYRIGRDAKRDLFVIVIGESSRNPRYGLGPSWVYVDAHSGALLAADWAAQGTAGDLALREAFQVHSGQIAGLPGRILIAITGLAVAVLVIVGLRVWWQRRRPVGR